MRAPHWQPRKRKRPVEYPFIAAILIGLFSSLHCLGMCGGIMGALTFSLPREVREQPQTFGLYLAAYNLGRIGSYAAAGALLGGVGGTFYEVVSPRWAHLALQAASALLLTGIGLYLAGWFPKFALLERIGVPLWQRLEPLSRRLLPVRSPLYALLYGMVWGWLPCGLVYSTLLWTLTAHGSGQGALFMAAFGVGTLPAVMAAGMLTGWITRLTRLPYVRPLVGLTIIALGLATVLVSGLAEEYNPWGTTISRVAK